MASSCGARLSGMGRPEGIEAVLAAKFQVLLPHLDERQRRLAIGAEALSLGHGGIRIVAAAAGVREATVSRGAAELDSGQAPLGRVRHPGGGRKRAAELDSRLRPALLALVEPDERGDPMITTTAAADPALHGPKPQTDCRCGDRVAGRMGIRTRDPGGASWMPTSSPPSPNSASTGRARCLAPESGPAQRRANRAAEAPVAACSPRRVREGAVRRRDMYLRPHRAVRATLRI
ncbi:hypothetical protein HNQ79_006732 [Streptomyces candidus]|uniref:Uncharacterized protein n=1 Tax=Streptomyces candidus TaxID=67283 RepID=A0A7X0LTF3_9ACTN|nr:hypothetical protein [Streptomyces candidus]